MRPAVDDVRRAYALLGLRSGAGLTEVRRRYRTLVKKWHPDRHAADPVGQADAAYRMRQINVAYGLLMRQLGRGNARQQVEPETSESPQIPRSARLSREEIESMVRAIGSEGPLDSVLNALGWVGGTIEGILAILFVIACVVRVAMRLLEGDPARLLKDPGLLLPLAILILLLVGEYLERRELERL